MDQESQLPQDNQDKSRLNLHRKPIVLAVIFLVLACVLSLVFQDQLGFVSERTTSSTAPVSLQQAQLKDRQRATLQIGTNELTVEVVAELASIEQGLSGRSEIGSDGMLFLLPLRQKPAFWMKEMQFDLDMVWIDGERVIGVTANVPAPEASTPLSELPNFRPPGAVTAVLELPAGEAKSLGIETGSVVQIVQ